MKDTAKSARGTARPTTARPATDGITAEEREAVREWAREKRAAARGQRPAQVDGTGAVLAKIAEMAEPDRAMAGRLHSVITAAAPALVPRTWYGMPAYAKDGDVLCFFQARQKFKTRYATLGFSDKAALDGGAMWPTAYALTALGPAEEEQVRQLIRRALGAAHDEPVD